MHTYRYTHILNIHGWTENPNVRSHIRLCGLRCRFYLIYGYKTISKDSRSYYSLGTLPLQVWFNCIHIVFGSEYSSIFSESFYVLALSFLGNNFHLHTPIAVTFWWVKQGDKSYRVTASSEPLIIKPSQSQTLSACCRGRQSEVKENTLFIAC